MDIIELNRYWTLGLIFVFLLFPFFGFIFYTKRRQDKGKPLQERYFVGFIIYMALAAVLNHKLIPKKYELTTITETICVDVIKEVPKYPNGIVDKE